MNISELEVFCQEEWGEIRKARIEKCLAGYRKRLQVAIIDRGGVTKYLLTGFPNFCTWPFSFYYYFETIKNANNK